LLRRAGVLRRGSSVARDRRLAGDNDDSGGGGILDWGRTLPAEIYGETDTDADDDKNDNNNHDDDHNGQPAVVQGRVFVAEPVA
jgi:hypothetical protein